MVFILREFTDVDVDAVDEIIKAAYNNPLGRKVTLHQYLAFQPVGAFVVQENKTIIGFGAALNYEVFSYLGLISVHPSAQKRGVGLLLVEKLTAWSTEQGCTTVLLDSSQAGEALYHKYGYIEDDKTLHFRYVQQKMPAAKPAIAISPMTTQDIVQLVAFDKVYFGASREMLLNWYFTYTPQRMLVSHGDSGEITGYIVAQEHAIGPWVAHSPKEAETLLSHALSLPYASKPTVFTSIRHTAASALLKSYGFEQVRSVSHMRKGPMVQRGRATGLYGQTSLGFG